MSLAENELHDPSLPSEAPLLTTSFEEQSQCGRGSYPNSSGATSAIPRFVTLGRGKFDTGGISPLTDNVPPPYLADESYDQYNFHPNCRATSSYVYDATPRSNPVGDGLLSPLLHKGHGLVLSAKQSPLAAPNWTNYVLSRPLFVSHCSAQPALPNTGGSPESLKGPTNPSSPSIAFRRGKAMVNSDEEDLLSSSYSGWETDEEWSSDDDSCNIFSARGRKDNCEQEQDLKAAALAFFKQALVDYLMCEFWVIFDRQWTSKITNCTDSGDNESRSVSTSGRLGNPLSNSTPSGNGLKRSRGKGDEYLSDDDGETPKRPTSSSKFQRVHDGGRKLACPFRKHNPSKYNFQDFPQCASSGWDRVHRVK